MDYEKVLLTNEGIQKLKAERDQLVNIERPKVIEELQLARSQGDLSENADYDAARERQAHVESRIKEIDEMLANAQIIDDALDTDVVRAGSTVTVADLSEEDADETADYTIVGSFETDPTNHKISNESPLAKAIIGHRVGEEVTVQVENPYRVRIEAIK